MLNTGKIAFGTVFMITTYQLVSSFSDGPPLGLANCETMLPTGHHFSENIPNDSTCKISVTRNSNQGKTSPQVLAKIQCKKGMKGIFVQAREDNINKTDTYGRFEITSNLTKTLSCNPKKNPNPNDPMGSHSYAKDNALGHVLNMTNTVPTEVTFGWSPVDEVKGKRIRFQATIVINFTLAYIDVRSIVFYAP